MTRLADLPADERIDALYAAREDGKVPDGEYHRLDVVKTLSEEATELPGEFFDGPNDRTFAANLELGAYEQIRGRVFSTY